MAEEKCPYCGNLLEEGTIRNRGGAYYLPASEKRPPAYIKKHLKKKRAILIPPGLFDMVPNWPKAYVCRNCKKIIMPYEEEWE